MKRILLYLLLFISYNLSANDGGHAIKIKIAPIKDGTCLLVHYYCYEGYTNQIKDTAKFERGYMVFKGNNKLPQGIYFIVRNKKRYFDFVVDSQQVFTIVADTSNAIEKMKVLGSDANSTLLLLHTFVKAKNKEAEPLLKVVSLNQNKDTVLETKHKVQHIDKEVREYYKKIYAANSTNFLGRYLKAVHIPVDLTEIPKLPNGKRDSIGEYQSYLQHYWDNTDLNDDAILRYENLYLHNKLKTFFGDVLIQHPDTIIKYADILIEKSKGNKDVFKYLIYWLTNHAETSSIMGMDAVFVYMVDTYYTIRKVSWLDSLQLRKVLNRGAVLKPLLIGKTAPELVLSDTTGSNMSSLHAIKAHYTVLYFWDPTCNHCQKETPILKEFADKYKYKGIKVYAVSAEGHDKEWKEYIRQNKLNWINVSNAYGQYDLREVYDIHAFPVIYLLDEKKTIVAKKLPADQLGAFIDRRE